MNKIFLLIFGLLLFSGLSYGQTGNENAIYIIDSIPILKEPSQEDASIDPNDIDHMVVLRNKDSLIAMGYDKMDVAFFVFTKAYVNRPEAIKKIPSTLRMTKENGLWCLYGSPYTGPFIDYYFNGAKEGEGTFKEGVVTGRRVNYSRKGHVSFETHYANGKQHGTETEYYEDGSMRQKGDFKDGVEVGVWETYFPNGQVMQHSVFEDGKIIGETLIYYSTGRLNAREVIKNGKVESDPALEKIRKLYSKGVEAEKDGNHKQAYKHYTKCIEADSNYAEAYFARGTSKLNEQQYDDAIADYDKVLSLEPYMKEALFNRALSLIRKHTLGRRISSNKSIIVMAVKKDETIPTEALERICSDLHRALLMDPESAKVKEAIAAYCVPH